MKFSTVLGLLVFTNLVTFVGTATLYTFGVEEILSEEEFENFKNRARQLLPS